MRSVEMVKQAAKGKRIIAALEWRQDMLDMQKRCVDAADPKMTRVSRANGLNRIDFEGGGYIKFRCMREGGVRGCELVDFIVTDVKDYDFDPHFNMRGGVSRVEYA